MGMIGSLLSTVFGGGRNVVAETAQVFRENAEASAQRDAQAVQTAMAQFGAEFTGRRSWFDQLIDGLNRLPRPMLAYGTLGLFLMAMIDPVWFASRMQGIALVPEPLWWLMGAVVSFYFGARHQVKTQQFQESLAKSMAMLPQVTASREALAPHAPKPVQQAANDTEKPTKPRQYVSGPNAALDAWYLTQA